MNSKTPAVADSAESARTPADRRPYATPTITVYGAVRELTAGGSLNLVEAGNALGMN